MLFGKMLKVRMNLSPLTRKNIIFISYFSANQGWINYHSQVLAPLHFLNAAPNITSWNSEVLSWLCPHLLKESYSYYIKVFQSKLFCQKCLLRCNTCCGCSSGAYSKAFKIWFCRIPVGWYDGIIIISYLYLHEAMWFQSHGGVGLFENGSWAEKWGRKGGAISRVRWFF